ncbi:MAG TPA: M56 family metallopeptidase [Silvibacterium sp.]|nr:M56 family metallopeptidase [Silvibacterium sp.]
MTCAMEAIGWTLIHFCWQAAVIALLYWLADAVLSKSRSHIRYVAALAALFTMLAAATATLIYERAASSHDWAANSRSHDDDQRSGPRVSGNAATAADPAMTAPDPGVPILVAFHDAVQARVRGAMPWLDAMWLLGVLCLSARTIGGWWLIQRLRRTSMTSVPSHVRDSFMRLAKRIGIDRPIDLRISARISSPLAMGVLKSIVLLPASALTSLSPEQLEVVLAHELAHIRRADYLWNILQTTIETLFFFHPAVWWVGKNLSRQRELCCDDAALECCTDPVTYATALLRLEEERSSRLHLAMALDGHERGGLRARIARILGETPEASRDVVPFSLIGACAMLGVLLLVVPRLFADLNTSATIQGPTPLLASTVALPHEPKIAGDPNGDRPAPAVSVTEAKPAPKPAAAPKPASAPEPVNALEPANAPANRPKAPQAPAAAAHAPDAGSAVAQAVLSIPPSSSAPMMLMAITRVTKTKDKANFFLASSSATAAAQSASSSPASSSRGSSGGDYIDRMRAAGYDVDFDKYVAMKIQGITPEYAHSMATTGFGKPTADELIAMKVQGVDPGEVAELKSAGIEPGSYQDLITYRIFKVSPEFVSGMKAAGFSSIPAKKLVELRIQGVTPEFAKTTKQQWPDATVDQLVQLRIFNINGAFIASAKRHGLEPLTIDKLVRVRISGILDDETPRAGSSK